MKNRLFFVLWIFTLLVELISLQIRLAIFGGMGWLTTIKFTTFPDRLGFILVLSIFCAAFCGIWTALFHFIGNKLKFDENRVSRVCATTWIAILAIDLVFRHKVSELLGNAFNFFDFATGVGGVWSMISQAFQWYGDVIIASVVGIAVVCILSWLFFRWFFKPHKKKSFLEYIPRPVMTVFIVFSVIFGFLFMSVFAPSFPASHNVLANETMFGTTISSFIHVTTDVDGDGYGPFDLPSDTAPFDGNIHPHAIDIPEDGIDQDSLLGDLKYSDVPEETRKRIDEMGTPNNQTFIDRRNVVLVLMESVRHDMIDARIDGKYVMPELRKLISNGAVRVDGAFASRGFTQNSVTQAFWGSFFDPGHSLLDDFKALGYYTAAFSGEDLLDEGFDESLGWNRSGDTIVDPRNIEENIYHHASVPARVLMDHVEPFLEKYDTAQPLFMYVFYQDPHFPYQQYNPDVLIDRPIKRSEITAETRPRLWKSYANQVHHLDKAAGRLINALEKKGMLDNTLLIFISDHGESLFDDGYLLGHGTTIGDIMTHCVMAVHGARHSVPALLTHVDLRKFILEDFKSRPLRSVGLEYNKPPIMQFIGATTVPAAISHRYEDGRRVTYEFPSQTAWQENPMMCLDGEKNSYTMPDHGNTPIDTHISLDQSLLPGMHRKAPIPYPLDNPEIRELIHTWEYLQWKKRQ